MSDKAIKRGLSIILLIRSVKEFINLRGLSLLTYACLFSLSIALSWPALAEMLISNDLMAKLRIAESAKLVLIVGNNEWNIKEWTEEGIDKGSCSYATVRKEDIGSLIKILGFAHIEDDSFVSNLNSMRIMLYLQLPNKEVFKLFINFSESKYTRGNIKFGTETEWKGFKSDLSLRWYLLFWASKLSGKPIAFDEKILEECNAHLSRTLYLQHYRYKGTSEFIGQP